jgi:hypothetical protein
MNHIQCARSEPIVRARTNKKRYVSGGGREKKRDTQPERRFPVESKTTRHLKSHRRHRSQKGVLENNQSHGVAG